MVRNGKLYMRPILGCRIVENESLLLPTPTRSFGVNARGWGLSQTGRLRYSQQTEDNAKRFGYRPPIALLEWMMGFPENHTAIELAASGMPLSQRQPSGSEGRSLITTKCSTEVETVGLTISGDVTYEEWEDIGYQLARVGKGWQWWVGDWINFGEKKYGETYKAAIEATGLKRESCHNIASVCRAFEPSRRHEGLTFNHHVAAMGLDAGQEQDDLLAEAEEYGLSCAAIRERVKSLKGIATKPEAEEFPSVDADPEQLDDEPLIIDVVEAFDHCDNRLNTLKQIVSRLAEHEKQILIQWLQGAAQ
jgi:hypothetical protein